MEPHTLIQRTRDYHGALKLLIVSILLLPLLPDQGYGPWQAVNPYELWWMVVLIAAISFMGFVAIRLIGTRRGMVATGLLGGLISSTAATLSLARLNRDGAPADSAAAGILLSCSMMFPRILLVASVLSPTLGWRLAPSIALMTLISCGAGLWQLRSSRAAPSDLAINNPFSLWPAVQFGVLLSAVVLITEACRHWLGQEGLYLATFFSSIADVDAITLTIGRLNGGSGEVTLVVAAHAVVLAAATNTVVKGGMAALIGRAALAAKVLPWLLTAATAGLCLEWLLL